MKLPFVSRSTAEALQLRLDELNHEYQNFRRRNAGIEETAHQKGCAAVITRILPVYDNLQRALEQPCTDEAFLTGIRMTMQELTKVLSQLGVEEIPALEQPFDPVLHEAMEHIEDPELPENIITKVILTGFRQGGTVLRHALVVVAN